MTNIAIIGYGNLGEGVEKALRDKENSDMNLVGIFTRRDPSQVTTTFPESAVYNIDDLLSFKDDIDVCILCGGSKDDIMVQGPQILEHFNTVDSFDTHAKILDYRDIMREVGIRTNHLAIISGGWDPGEMSQARFKASYILPNSTTNWFWGPGYSQGHSNALPPISGVKYGAQDTLPKEDGVERAYAGEALTGRDKISRRCWIVPEEDADLEEIEQAIKAMPDYFEPYETEVHFISEQEFMQNHTQKPHRGFTLTVGLTGGEHKAMIKHELIMDDNPSFTAGPVISLARACDKMSKRGETGAKTVFEVTDADRSPMPLDEAIRTFL